MTTFVKDMKEKILEYCDPFLNAPVRHLMTGVEIDVDRFIIIHRDWK